MISGHRSNIINYISVQNKAQGKHVEQWTGFQVLLPELHEVPEGGGLKAEAHEGAQVRYHHEQWPGRNGGRLGESVLLGHGSCSAAQRSLFLDEMIPILSQFLNLLFFYFILGQLLNKEWAFLWSLLLCFWSLLFLCVLGCVFFFYVFQPLKVLLGIRKSLSGHFLHFKVEIGQRLFVRVFLLAFLNNFSQLFRKKLAFFSNLLQLRKVSLKLSVNCLQVFLLFFNVFLMHFDMVLIRWVSFVFEDLIMSQKRFDNRAKFGQGLLKIQINVPIGLYLSVILSVVHDLGWFVRVIAFRIHCGHRLGDSFSVEWDGNRETTMILRRIRIKLFSESLIAFKGHILEWLLLHEFHLLIDFKFVWIYHTNYHS